jgi:O-antigen/teichoic acid export membrane protein
MHWPKDLGEWGFWIAVVAFILVIPLNMLSNVLTPRLQDWWSMTSKKRLARRIIELNARLEAAQMIKAMTPYEEYMARMSWGQFSMVMIFTYMIYSAIVFALAYLWNDLPSHLSDYRYFLMVLCMFGMMLNFIVSNKQGDSFMHLNDRSRAGLKELQSTLERLKRTLAD